LVLTKFVYVFNAAFGTEIFVRYNRALVYYIESKKTMFAKLQKRKHFFLMGPKNKRGFRNEVSASLRQM